MIISESLICTELSEKGYHIFNFDNIQPIIKIRELIVDYLNRNLDLKIKQDELINFNFSSYSNPNLIRKELINYLVNYTHFKSLIWESLQEKVISIYGPDIVGQKRPNLVIHSPGSVDNAPVHRDSPPHSKFDLVAWIPLVDVYESNSMYIADKENSHKLSNLLEEEKVDLFKSEFNKRSLPLNLEFGSAVLFIPELWHSPKINNTSDTRWSINTRYRGLFYPSGAKGIPDYFEPISLSKITKYHLDKYNE